MRRTMEANDEEKNEERSRREHARGTCTEQACVERRRARMGEEENSEKRGRGMLTEKDPNRRVNTLLTLRREARKPNGIRFGDLVGGLRRPPAATTAFAHTLSSAIPHDLHTDILRPPPASRRRHRGRQLPCGRVRADSSQELECASSLAGFFAWIQLESSEAITR